MANCIIAQSGGPSPVINATVAGVVKANQLNPVYDHVYGGLNGIEGIMQERFIDLTDMNDHENLVLRQTPSSALGSCRHKLRRDRTEEFEKINAIMDKYDVETLFYIGGNDSMDTVAALHEYAVNNGITHHRFIGCPKTIDNDLMFLDHCPGFGSSAKYIATTTLQCWYDLNVYPSSRREVLIVETMGRDAGWLAASACLSGIVDLLVIPEKGFDKGIFLKRVREIVNERSKCVVVVSEGARYEDGTYISVGNMKHDPFGHAVLGGTARALEALILDAGIAPRCRIQDLSIAQRCHATEQSLVDVTESFQLGMSALNRSADKTFTGKVTCLRRKENAAEYAVEYFVVDADQIANNVKGFPVSWLLKDHGGITEEAVNYMKPLIQGTPEIIMKDGLPEYTYPYYMRSDEELVTKK